MPSFRPSEDEENVLHFPKGCQKSGHEDLRIAFIKRSIHSIFEQKTPHRFPEKSRPRALARAQPRAKFFWFRVEQQRTPTAKVAREWRGGFFSKIRIPRKSLMTKYRADRIIPAARGSASLAALVGCALARAVELRSSSCRFLFCFASQKYRADRIRTCDLLNPIQAHYQAVLQPVVREAKTPPSCGWFQVLKISVLKTIRCRYDSRHDQSGHSGCERIFR